jgi:hypothetical protein
MLKITSRDNPKIKKARKVRDGAIENLIFIEGLRLAEKFPLKPEKSKTFITQKASFRPNVDRLFTGH